MKEKLCESWGEEVDPIMELAEAACAFDPDEKVPASLQRARDAAIHDTIGRVSEYRAKGIRNDLVHIVFEKRLALIKEATTVQDLKEIQSEPRPRYSAGAIVAGKLSVPEEEMIMWSLTSLKAPLNEAGMKRYNDLFQQIFGFDPMDRYAKEEQEVSQ